MLVKIGWAGCPDREGVNSRVAQAKQSIELHRGKWRGCLRKLGGAALIATHIDLGFAAGVLDITPFRADAHAPVLSGQFDEAFL